MLLSTPYDYDSNTGQSAWERPPAAAPKAAAAAPKDDAASSADTGSSTGPLPAGWEEVRDDSGNVFYYNAASGASDS